MSVLKPKDKRADLRFVGANLSPKFHSQFSLWVVAKGEKKTEIIVQLIKDWLKDELHKTSETDLVREIIQRAQLQWSIAIKKKPESQIEVFKAELEQELLDKGILPDHVETIIKWIK
jgi:hypothetical protein